MKIISMTNHAKLGKRIILLFQKRYHEQLHELGLQYAIWEHIGDGHVHVNVIPRDLSEYEQARALFHKWAHIISEIGGSVSAEHGVGKLKTHYLKIMYGDDAIDEMIRLKQKFDPKMLLNIGNLFAEQV